MDLYCTEHSHERRLEKRISKEMVEGVLSAPRWTPATTRGIRYGGVVDGRRLAVVIDEPARATPAIVTVFWVDE